MADKEKVIINFCPTGMIPTKAMTPFVPVTPQEIIEQTQEAFETGITIAHLHARDQQEVPTWDPEVYREIFEGVRKHCPGLIICGSCSGRNFPEFEKRSAVIELKPDMCSLTLSSLNFVDKASLNAPDIIQRLAQKMKDFGVNPELECFDLGMINYGHYLLKKGWVGGPYYWNLIFGNIAGFQATIRQIGMAVSEIPDSHFVSLGALGAQQLPTHTLAVAMGYGVRVGLEDNIWWDSGRSKKASNIDLIKRIHNLLEIQGKEYYPPQAFGKLGFYNGK